MSTYAIRHRLVEIARQFVGQTEVTKNHAPWIKPLWDATGYGQEGYANREPYCATGQCWVQREWGREPEVLKALGLSPEGFEKWRCKSAAVAGWREWAADHKLIVLPRECILHMGDLVVYSYSHIELVTGDDNTPTGQFTGLGFNTNAAAARDGEGCFEKPRSRGSVKCFIRTFKD